jgi:crotonobetainyl-CoA:carnitine CoA-transferase CaiB-like acyl-CoA transferase
VRVQAPVAQLSETPGSIAHLGQSLGAENEAVYGELLELKADRISALRATGVI